MAVALSLPGNGTTSSLIMLEHDGGGTVLSYLPPAENRICAQGDDFLQRSSGRCVRFRRCARIR